MIHQMIVPRRTQSSELRLLTELPRYVVLAFKMVVSGLNPATAKLQPESSGSLIDATRPSRRITIAASMLKAANDN